MILRQYQNKAVDELETKTLELLGQAGCRKKLVFKAPTGAGKTVMMAAWLQRMALSLPAQYEMAERRFAYLWIAPNQLHEQSLMKLRGYFEKTRTLRCLQWDGLDSTCLQENDVLFFNWQSISREDALIIRENETGRNLEALLAQTRRQGVEIVVILDEAQLFATRGDKAQKLLEMVHAKMEIDVSATPLQDRMPDALVTVNRNDVVREEMIKERIILNPEINDMGQGTGLNEYLLGEAFKKLKDLARRYTQMGSSVRPLLLVQLPNDSKTLSAEDRLIRELVEQWFSIRDITKNNGKLAIWLSNETANLEGVEAFDSPVEVLLFKQAISMGWDCPRAAVLVIFRDLQNVNFTIQTVGRILRMPEQRHYADNALNLGYVFTNLARDRIQVVQDDQDYLVLQRAQRLAEYEKMPLGLKSATLDRRMVRNRLNSSFRKILRERLMSHWGWVHPTQNTDYRALNEKNLAFQWQLDVKKIEVVIPKDVYLSGEVQVLDVRQHRTRYAKTSGELDSLLHRFCLQAVGSYAKVDSAPVLKMALLFAFEEFLDLDELSAAKVILYHDQTYQNDARVQEIVDDALAEYSRLQAVVARVKQASPEREDWDVPLVREYPEGFYQAKSSQRHILRAYYQQKKASNPEIRFVEFLEAQHRHLRWWYKNGEASREHFAVPYRNLQDEWSLFYVDFIIVLSDGTVALFDTKTLGSDENAARKHNALQEYLHELRQRFPERRFLGGVLIEDGLLWKFSPHRLEDNFRSLEGWESFDPTRAPYYDDFDSSFYDVSDPEPESQLDLAMPARKYLLKIVHSRYDSFCVSLNPQGKMERTHVILDLQGKLKFDRFRDGCWEGWQPVPQTKDAFLRNLFAQVHRQPQEVLKLLQQSTQNGFSATHSGTWIEVHCADDAQMQSNRRVLLHFQTEVSSAPQGLFAEIMELA